MRTSSTFMIAVVVVVGGAGAGCPERGPTPPGDEAGATISLLPLEGDVWAFALDVRGPVRGCALVDVIVDPVDAGGEGPRSTRATIEAGAFAAVVALDEGNNHVTARCHTADGAIDSEVRTYRVRLVDRPTAIARARIDGDEVVLDAASRAAERSRAPFVQRWSRAGVDLGEVREGASVRVPVPNADGAYTFVLDVEDARGASDRAAALVIVEGGVARVPTPEESPSWVPGAVVYGAVPPLFGYAGIASITERLDALVALGVDVVWVSPVTQATFGDFGFDVTDHFHINPELGTEEDLVALVDEAHARGLRVILDVVPNHTSSQHPYFVDALEHGEDSRTWSFYDRDEDGEATYYFDWDYLLNLDYGNPEVERMMIESFTHWVRDFDVDGFRIDAAWGVLDRDPTFWPRLRSELQRMKPDVFLLGEASARDPRVLDAFHAGYDWTDELGVWAWQSAVDDGPPYAPAFREAIDAVADVVTLHFLDNNDTGARFRDDHGADLTRAARALTMFAPGLAGVYVGDELGASFEPYEQYDPLAWDEGDPAIYEELANLIALRKAHPAFASDAFAIVDTDANDDVLAFTRGDGDEQVLVLISFTDVALEVTVSSSLATAVALPPWGSVVIP